MLRIDIKTVENIYASIVTVSLEVVPPQSTSLGLIKRVGFLAPFAPP